MIPAAPETRAYPKESSVAQRESPAAAIAIPRFVPTATMPPVATKLKASTGVPVRPKVAVDMTRVAAIRSEGAWALLPDPQEDSPAKPEAIRNALVEPGAFEPAACVIVSPKTPAPALTPRGFAVDLARIAQLLAESQRVDSLLGSIFVDEHSSVATQSHSQGLAVLAQSEWGPNLDATHAGFAQLVIVQPTWDRVALEAMAAEHDLMLDGALEIINDHAFEMFGEPLIEGDETLEVSTHVLAQMRSARG
jgi:hypothetical protein